MKAYEQLTRLGRIRRLHGLVLKAMQYYDLPVKQVRFFRIETNTMFLVRCADGEKYVLRIYSEGDSTLKENQAEVFWLTAILRDTDLKVCEPVARRDVDYITIVTVPGVPANQRCVLYKWIPGRELEYRLNEENYYKLGRLMAKLHNHAYTLKPLPGHIRPKRWDKVFYYPDEPILYNKPAYSHLFPPQRVRLLEEVMARANEVFARLFADRDGPILIHGDLHYWNVHVHRGELYAMDFEDVLLGYPIQDIAVTLSYGRGRDGHSQWEAAFKRGYSSVRPWPDESEKTMHTLMAARSVMFVNYVPRIDPSPLEYIEERCEVLQEYLDTYG